MSKEISAVDHRRDVYFVDKNACGTNSLDLRETLGMGKGLYFNNNV